MSDIARRSISKVTYAPIRPDDSDRDSGAVAKRQRAIEKIAFAAALRVTPQELEALKAARATARSNRSERRAAAADQPDILATLGLASQLSSRGARSAWKALGKTSTAHLVACARALAAHRRTVRAQLKKAARELSVDFAEHTRARMKKSEIGAGDDPRMSAASLRTSFGVALRWARVNAPDRAEHIARLTRDLTGIGVDPDLVTTVNWDQFTEEVVDTPDPPMDYTDDLTDGFEERMKVEPVGRLHLERIDMTPAGVMRGELMHSVGLAPHEKVTLIHREWSSRETSFEKVVMDEFEQSTEEGVTENTELSSATDVQSRHSSTLSTEASASGSWGFASASASIGYSSTSGDDVTKRDSRNHAIELTRKAAARTRKEHKVTFTVKEQSGVEDQSIRTLSNPSATDPMRIDFHQMLRKWKVDLYRYGLRLTYDIVVPAPGIDLLAQMDEMRRIDFQLSQSFTFPLQPSEITRGRWSELAAKYGATIEAPPPDPVVLSQGFTYALQSEEEAKQPRYDSLNFNVPDGYVVRDGRLSAHISLYKDGRFDVPDDPRGPSDWNPQQPNIVTHQYLSTLTHLNGRTGEVRVPLVSVKLKSGIVDARLEIVQTQSAWAAWQSGAWSAMRQAAESQWQASRQELRERREQLSEVLAQWDPLTLRRMEREEIMKTTLKWIMGPAFDLIPSEVYRLYASGQPGVAKLDPASISPEQWAQVMGFGEFIKFMHQAIEWENVLYFVYPYFWDAPQNHSLKRFLHHPDALHRAFLRGGAARVVLTVRPGFEKSFTSLLETADWEAELPGDHPYMTIAEEIRNYASQHYPGIPGIDADTVPDAEEVERKERGVHIAQWFEYTPVSALDISVNTPLEQLR
jgi:hypothetical protein